MKPKRQKLQCRAVNKIKTRQAKHAKYIKANKQIKQEATTAKAIAKTRRNTEEKLLTHIK